MATAHAEVESHKRAAAERALELVRPGTIVGLGTGSTARYFIDALGRRVRQGLKVQAVVTSVETRGLGAGAGGRRGRPGVARRGAGARGGGGAPEQGPPRRSIASRAGVGRSSERR